MQETDPQLTGGAILWMIAFFLPAIVAFLRRHRNAWAIATLDFMAILFLAYLGMLFFVPSLAMWTIAAIWSMTANTKEKRHHAEY